MTGREQLVQARAALEQWWAARQPRERVVLVIGIALAILVLPYTQIWEPLQERRETLRDEVDSLRAERAWMEGAAVTIGDEGGGGEPVVDDRSLLGLVNRTARSSGLESHVRRVQPDGDTSVRVWVEGAPFDEFTGWLDELDGGGLRIDDLLIERTDREGLVDARLTLEVAG